MAVNRIGIVLPMLGISGGINIVLNWAVILAKAGYRLDIILPANATKTDIPFLSESDARLLHVITEHEARKHHYHAAIATWWACLNQVADLDADHHAWFMQAYEGQFSEHNAPAQVDFDELIHSRMNVITSAHWLQQHIQRHYSFEPKQTFCVLSGLDKSLWKPTPRRPPGPGGDRVCFLVEGPVTDPRKNTARTIRMLESHRLAYRWVGANVDRALTGPNCRGIDEQVSYHRMPEIYGSADVLVKASNAEGMFGPPLEMFATGGTAAVWHVQGAEEYMTDRYNSCLVPMNSWSRLAETALELDADPSRVRQLQQNALATAEAWPTWEDQADQILATIENLVPFGRASLVRQAAKNRFRPTLNSFPLRKEGDARRAETQRADAEARRADAEAQRARHAETELEQLRRLFSSRSWRFANALQRARASLAPDGSRRWAYTLWAGRLAKRARRIASTRGRVA